MNQVVATEERPCTVGGSLRHCCTKFALRAALPFIVFVLAGGGIDESPQISRFESPQIA